MAHQAQTLADLVTRGSHLFADATAVVFRDRSYSFRHFDQASARIAKALEARGIRPGDRVSLYGPNSADWIAVYFGILRTGAVVNPVNSMLTADEMAYVLRDCGAVGLFASHDSLVALSRLGVLEPLRAVVSLDSPCGGYPHLAAFVQAVAPDHRPPPIDPGALSTLCYTSGTTGRPKGAMHTHAGVVTNVKLTALMHGRNAADTAVSALPCPHVYGNVVMNAAFLTGGSLILHERFDAPAVLESISHYRATIFDGVPTMYMYLLGHAALETADLASLRICTVGGQTMPVPRIEEVERRFGCPLIELWGMTELAGLGTTFAHWGPTRAGSIGVPLPYVEARIADIADPRTSLGVDQPGELLVRGPIVMKGYFGNDAATREVIDADGWLRTGDIAQRDADGYLYIVDRRKDMILTAGFNVYPAEIERVIAEHPAVAMVAVGRVPDALKGELAKAYVVLRPGAVASAEQIFAHCRGRLAAYKLPRQVQFVPDLPKTSSGKILRRELHQLDSATPSSS